MNMPELTTLSRWLGMLHRTGNGLLPADTPRGWKVTVDRKTFVFTDEQRAEEYALRSGGQLSAIR